MLLLLQSLMTIKEVESKKSSEMWAGLSADEKKQYEGKLREAVMIAKNRNMLSKKTVRFLELVTTDVSKYVYSTCCMYTGSESILSLQTLCNANNGR